MLYAAVVLIITDVENKESSKQPFRIYLLLRLADRGMSVQKEKNFSAPNLKYCQFELDG